MIRLFAGLGTDGQMRFIGEVERGAACACFCPECRSPLIAKQGDLKDWHFAHEAGQERPECEAGAANMLRRMAVEYLVSLKTIELPDYVETLKQRTPLRTVTEDVTWPVKATGSFERFVGAARSAPAGRVRLDTGFDLDIYVEVGDQVSRTYPAREAAPPSVVFWSSVPVPSDLRKRLYAVQHLRNYGRMIWKHHPDIDGRIAATRARLQAIADHDSEAVERDRNTSTYSSTAARHEAAMDQQPNEIPVDLWVPERLPSSTFLCYQMPDASVWIVYTLADGSQAVAPFPPRKDGWQSALPSIAATVDEELGAYRTRHLSAVVMVLSRLTNGAGIRSASNASELAGVLGWTRSR